MNPTTAAVVPLNYDESALHAITSSMLFQILFPIQCGEQLPITSKARRARRTPNQQAARDKKLKTTRKIIDDLPQPHQGQTDGYSLRTNPQQL